MFNPIINYFVAFFFNNIYVKQLRLRAALFLLIFIIDSFAVTKPNNLINLQEDLRFYLKTAQFNK